MGSKTVYPQCYCAGFGKKRSVYFGCGKPKVAVGEKAECDTKVNLLVRQVENSTEVFSEMGESKQRKAIFSILQNILRMCKPFFKYLQCDIEKAFIFCLLWTLDAEQNIKIITCSECILVYPGKIYDIQKPTFHPSMTVTGVTRLLLSNFSLSVNDSSFIFL